PWSLGDEVARHARAWLDLRYRLLPYLWGCIEIATRTGLPVMRAMALAFPRDRAARAFEEQFMFGPSLLVAPILKPGHAVEVWLPEGGWYDFWTGQRVEGGRMLRIHNVPLDRLPVYVREGHIVALGRPVSHTGQIDRKHPIAEVRAYGMPANEPVAGDGVLSLRFEGPRVYLSGAGDASLRLYDCTATRESAAIAFGR
ncbi:MAG: hypothetical protein ACK5X0_01770, partial [Rhodospirillales bacterium]